MKRPELDDIFYHYSGEDCVLSVEELVEFLQDQGEKTNLAHARRIIQTYELNEKGSVCSGSLTWGLGLTDVCHRQAGLLP